MADERDDKEIAERQELERSLSMLRPADSRIGRDRFLFLAGRASVEPIRPVAVLGRWMWPAATLSSSLAAVVLLTLLVTRSGPGATPADAQVADDNRPSVPAVVEARGVAVVEPPGSAIDLPAIDPGPVPIATADEAARRIAATANYPRLRSFVLAYGIDALPEPAPLPASSGVSASGSEPRTERELLQLLTKGRG